MCSGNLVQSTVDGLSGEVHEVGEKEAALGGAPHAGGSNYTSDFDSPTKSYVVLDGEQGCNACIKSKLTNRCIEM